MAFKSIDRRSGKSEKVAEPEIQDSGVDHEMENLLTDVNVSAARVSGEIKDSIGIDLQAITEEINNTKPAEKRGKMEFILDVFKNIQPAFDALHSLKIDLSKGQKDDQDFQDGLHIKIQTEDFIEAAQVYLHDFSKPSEKNLKKELQKFQTLNLTSDSIQNFLDANSPLRKRYRQEKITEAKLYLQREVPIRRAEAAEDARIAEERRLVEEAPRLEAERGRVEAEAVERRRLASLLEGREVAPAEEFQWNETEARRLGLERLDLNANASADILIEQVISGTIDTNTPQGRKQFAESWNASCGDVKMPCVLERDQQGNINWQNSDFWYLIKLKENRIIKNLSGDSQPAKPNFNKNEMLLVDGYQETNWDAPDARVKLISPLLKELIGNESVVNIKRKDIDRALWGANPDLRQQSQKAKKIITKLGLNPAEFELRLIRQDEYARGAAIRVEDEKWGQSNLSTNYQDYFLGDDGDRRGLDGGYLADGGVSYVYFDWRVYANDGLAVRLVLSRKQ